MKYLLKIKHIAGVLFTAVMMNGVPVYAEEITLKPLVFEAEQYSTCAVPFTYNKLTQTAWNVWSTDTDADKKWSQGIVMQSPKVTADRASADEGAPPVHTVLTGIPLGKYRVVIKLGRTLAVSFDGKSWQKTENGSLGIFDITDGTFTVYVDDMYANKNPGSSYYDNITLYPVPQPVKKPQLQGTTGKKSFDGQGSSHTPGSASARVLEPLDRGLITVLGAGKVYLSWRLLESDTPDTSFNVFRIDADGSVVKLNAKPITDTTDFVINKPARQTTVFAVQAEQSSGNSYAAGADEQASAGEQSAGHNQADNGEALTLSSGSYVGTPAYRSIKLRGGHKAQKIGIGDLNGDGKPDFVCKTPDINVDPYELYWKRSPGTYSLEAYLHDGTFLWQYDMGFAIEQGIWYSPYIVYDFDGDGKAEIVLKTGEGDLRGADGKVTDGTEYLTVLDGMSGKIKAQTVWPSRDGFSSYNYYSRNQLGMAYLDGEKPYIIAERGTYNTIKVNAYSFSGTSIDEVWRWSDSEEADMFSGQGAHILRCADVDDDGRDEVIIGSAVIDDNGNGLWTTGLGHPDCVTVGDLDTERAGLEIQYNLEKKQTKNGICMADAATGRILWGLNEATSHVHSSGLCADVDVRYPGSESFGGERDDPDKRWLFTSAGVRIEGNIPVLFSGLSPRAVYWDDDAQREIIDRGYVYNFEVLKDGTGNRPDSGDRIKGTVIGVADIDGDWREEIITSETGEVRIYTTSIPAKTKMNTLLRDDIYRNGVLQFSQGYFQIPGLRNPPAW